MILTSPFLRISRTVFLRFFHHSQKNDLFLLRMDPPSEFFWRAWPGTVYIVILGIIMMHHHRWNGWIWILMLSALHSCVCCCCLLTLQLSFINKLLAHPPVSAYHLISFYLDHLLNYICITIVETNCT